MSIVAFLLLISCTYTDLKKRTVSTRVLVIFLILTAGLMTGHHIIGDRYGVALGSLMYEINAENIIFSMIPGAMLLLISILTKEAIGRGDVYLVCLLGLMTGFERIFAVLFISMVSCAAFGGICMLVYGKGKKDTLPYVPFLLGAYLTIMIINKTGGI